MYRTVGTGFGDPHVEIQGDRYEYVVTERGTEFERRGTGDPDELMYWLVSDVIREMAIDHELQHRTPDQDHRRSIFQKEVELFSAIDPVWAARRQSEIAEILRDHPFRDGATW